MIFNKSLKYLCVLVSLVTPLKAMEMFAKDEKECAPQTKRARMEKAECALRMKRVIPHLNWEKFNFPANRPHEILLFDILVCQIYVCLERESAAPTITVSCPPPRQILGSDFINTLAYALNAQAFYLAIDDHLREISQETEANDSDTALPEVLSTPRDCSYMDQELLWMDRGARAEEREYRWRCRVQKKLDEKEEKLPFERVYPQPHSTPAFLKQKAQFMLQEIERCNDKLFFPNPLMPATSAEANLVLQELRLAFIKARAISQSVSPAVNSTSAVILRRRELSLERFSKLFTPDFESQLLEAAEETRKIP